MSGWERAVTKTYRAVIMDAETGGEGAYDFEAEDDLMAQTPVRVVRRFMEHADRGLFPHHHLDYELNAAFKNEGRSVVTALGSLILEHAPPLPFMLMITAAAAAARADPAVAIPQARKSL